MVLIFPQYTLFFSFNSRLLIRRRSRLFKTNSVVVKISFYLLFSLLLLLFFFSALNAATAATAIIIYFKLSSFGFKLINKTTSFLPLSFILFRFSNLSSCVECKNTQITKRARKVKMENKIFSYLLANKNENKNRNRKKKKKNLTITTTMTTKIRTLTTKEKTKQKIIYLK